MERPVVHTGMVAYLLAEGQPVYLPQGAASLRWCR
jgi:hypothetical protein